MASATVLELPLHFLLEDCVPCTYARLWELRFGSPEKAQQFQVHFGMRFVLVVPLVRVAVEYDVAGYFQKVEDGERPVEVTFATGRDHGYAFGLKVDLQPPCGGDESGTILLALH